MRITKMTVVALFVVGVGAIAYGEDKKQETQNLEVKIEKVSRCKFVDFGSELGTPIASIEALGDQIDIARLKSNPVDLVAAAKLLEAAEQASGKQASVTSKGLLAEAVSLAKERGNPLELLIVAKIVGGSTASELQEVAMAAKESEKEEGEGEKDLYGDLIVDNHSHSELHVYVDGREVGHVEPHSVQYFHVHHADHAEARDHYGHRWVSHFEYGHYHRYRMLIRDPHEHHYHH